MGIPIQVGSQSAPILDHDLYPSQSQIPSQRSGLFPHPRRNNLYLLQTGHDQKWD